MKIEVNELTTICLVRHGQTDWNFQHITQGREDIPLNKVGIQQAEDTANFLQKENWDAIISSPLSRAMDTARAIASKTKINEIATNENLVERHFGEASGKPYQLYLEKIRNGTVPGMEKNDELMERAYSAFCRIVEEYKGKDIIIVAHSHTIKAILHTIEPEKVQFTSPMANACSNFVVYEEGKYVIKEYNVHSHISV